jgi:phosphotransferase system HPr-like phosphotransfer protein
MKKVMEINLNTVNDIKEFVTLAMNAPCQIDICSGRFRIDARSLMGIFSLDLSKPVSIEIPLTANKNYVKNAFKKWEVA